VVRHAPEPAARALDPALLDRCRRGDRAALELVLAREIPDLERLLHRLAGPRADIDDALQATLLAAVQAFPRFRGEASLRTWLARIAVRIFFEDLRRPERRRRAQLEIVPGGEPGDVRQPSPRDQVDARRRLEGVYRHLATIAPKKRIAFVLHVLEGRPIDEVAALMGATAMATKSRVFWARRELTARVKCDPALRDLVDRDEPGGGA
jgi:RNA polymerase sigma-70 factor (ECF subfamily)